MKDKTIYSGVDLFPRKQIERFDYYGFPVSDDEEPGEGEIFYYDDGSEYSIGDNRYE